MSAIDPKQTLGILQKYLNCSPGNTGIYGAGSKKKGNGLHQILLLFSLYPGVYDPDVADPMARRNRFLRLDLQARGKLWATDPTRT